MSLLNTLLKFFGESNWAHVLDYESYGIINAEIAAIPAELTHFTSRIVLWTESGNTWNVVRTIYTPPDLWFAVRTTEDGIIDSSRKNYNLPDLFAIVNHTPTL